MIFPFIFPPVTILIPTSYLLLKWAWWVRTLPREWPGCPVLPCPALPCPVLKRTALVVTALPWLPSVRLKQDIPPCEISTKSISSTWLEYSFSQLPAPPVSFHSTVHWLFCFFSSFYVPHVILSSFSSFNQLLLLTTLYYHLPGLTRLNLASAMLKPTSFLDQMIHWSNLYFSSMLTLSLREKNNQQLHLNWQLEEKIQHIGDNKK